MTPKELRSKLKGATSIKAWVENEDSDHPDAMTEKPIKAIEVGDHLTITGKVSGERTLAQAIANDVVDRIEGELLQWEVDYHYEWVYPVDQAFDLDILRRAAHEMAEKAVGEAHAVLCRFKADVENLKALRRIAKGGGK